MPKAMIMKFSLPSFNFPFIRLVKGSVFYKLNLSFRPTVLSYIVILVFILSKLAMAKEFENQIEEIQSNTGAASETTKKILKKESRIVPVPIPISNPTLGVGLAGAILYMHPKSGLLNIKGGSMAAGTNCVQKPLQDRKKWGLYPKIPNWLLNRKT